MAIPIKAATASALLALMLAPALWNGFPLLEHDTGGYLARWYEGYLVPSRPAPYGLLLNISWPLNYWPALVIQAAAAIWLLHIALRLHGVSHAALRTGFVAALALITTLSLLASTLLTDIFCGLAIVSLYLLVFKDSELTRGERIAALAIAGFGAAAHTATLLLIVALALLAICAALVSRDLIPRGAAMRSTIVIVLGFVIVLSANALIVKRLAWTPGGFGIVFGRVLEDGIAKKYLDKHCPDPRLRLCPHRDALPPTADDFLWGSSVFNQLGRFNGLNDEMRAIVLGSLREFPLDHIRTALVATVRQLVRVKSGEGILNTVWHTYGMIEDYNPSVVPAMRAARQQREGVSFTVINWLHVPVALAAMALLPAIVISGAWRRRFGDVEWLALTVALALLANAAICGILSNPHDRYGARVAWLALLPAMLWAWREVQKANARRNTAGVAAGRLRG